MTMPAATSHSRFSSVWRKRRQADFWKARMLAIQAALADLIIRIDGEGNYIDVQAPIEGDLAAPLSEIIGLNVRDILPEEVAEMHRQAVHSVLTTGNVYEYEYALDVPSGRQYFDARLVRSGPNEITSIVRNITEKRRMAEDAEQQRLELMLERERRGVIERFIQDASHDIRTPITALMTTGFLLERYIETLEMQLNGLREAYYAGGDTSALAKEFVMTLGRLREKQQVMTLSSNRLKALVESMFEMIRLDTEEALPLELGSLEPVARLVAEMLAPEAEVRGIMLKLETVPLPPVMINAELMQRAVQNLVVNALNHTASGGMVSIRLYNALGAAVLEVSDSGTGIPAEHLPHIFQRFYRADAARSARAGGSGLGLAIVQRVVELHRATISVHSEVGVGTSFRIALPSK